MRSNNIMHVRTSFKLQNAMQCKLLLLVLMNTHHDIVNKNWNSWTERENIDNEVILMVCP